MPLQVLLDSLLLLQLLLLQRLLLALLLLLPLRLFTQGALAQQFFVPSLLVLLGALLLQRLLLVLLLLHLARLLPLLFQLLLRLLPLRLLTHRALAGQFVAVSSLLFLLAGLLHLLALLVTLELLLRSLGLLRRAAFGSGPCFLVGSAGRACRGRDAIFLRLLAQRALAQGFFGLPALCLLWPAQGALLALKVALQGRLFAPDAVFRVLGAAVLRVDGRAGSCRG